MLDVISKMNKPIIIGFMLFMFNGCVFIKPNYGTCVVRKEDGTTKTISPVVIGNLSCDMNYQNCFPVQGWDQYKTGISYNGEIYYDVIRCQSQGRTRTTTTATRIEECKRFAESGFDCSCNSPSYLEWSGKPTNFSRGMNTTKIFL